MAASNKILGIDLGTTNSCMAIIQAGELKVIPSREGEKTTPSVVAYAKNGDAIAGKPARRQAAANADNTVYSVKRFMGMKLKDPAVEKNAKMVAYHLDAAPNGDAWVKLSGRLLSPPEVSAQILTKLKNDAEAFLGRND